MEVFIHGNLAVERKPTPAFPEQKSKKYRKKSITMREKVLYLLTIVICVSIAGLIVSRYAQIYEMNTKIQQMEEQIDQLEKENVNLKLEVSRLKDPKRLISYAVQYGLKPPEEQNVRTVASSEKPYKENGAVAYTR